MKTVLRHLFEHKTLGKSQAKEVLKNMAAGRYNNSQTAAFLTAFIMRQITVDELDGFREAMLELCIPIDLDAFDPIDLCGTGGDGKDTFNISTLASFVVAGAGVNVAKHGNYGVSSVSGSSNVMEHFGCRFTNDADYLKRKMERAGICFLHAPFFHPAMKNVAPVRREMGVKTFFNMLGPMVNPCFPKRQLVGVFNLQTARLYGYLYQKTDKRYCILHALDGYDEISLTGQFKCIDNEGEQLLSPQHLGMATLQAGELAGGKTVELAAKLFYTILSGGGTPAQNNVVVANAGMAIRTARPQLSLPDALQAARDSLLGLHALERFKRLVEG